MITYWLSSSHSLADQVSRYMKAIQLVLLVGATVSLALFACMCAEIIPYCKAVLCLTFSLGGFFISGTIPLFFEMAVETAYPVAEGFTSCVLKISCTIPLSSVVLFFFRCCQSLVWSGLTGARLQPTLLAFRCSRYGERDIIAQKWMTKEERITPGRSNNIS